MGCNQFVSTFLLPDNSWQFPALGDHVVLRILQIICTFIVRSSLGMINNWLGYQPANQKVVGSFPPQDSLLLLFPWAKKNYKFTHIAQLMWTGEITAHSAVMSMGSWGSKCSTVIISSRSLWNCGFRGLYLRDLRWVTSPAPRRLCHTRLKCLSNTRHLASVGTLDGNSCVTAAVSFGLCVCVCVCVYCCLYHKFMIK